MDEKEVYWFLDNLNDKRVISGLESVYAKILIKEIEYVIIHRDFLTQEISDLLRAGIQSYILNDRRLKKIGIIGISNKR